MKRWIWAGIALAVAAGPAVADNEDYVLISLPDIGEVHRLDLKTKVMTPHATGMGVCLYAEIDEVGSLTVRVESEP